MKISKFQIKNYRAISDLELVLNYSINPIIGVNESGKTTILQALLAFDKGQDKLQGGEHLEAKNRYLTNRTADSTITASLELDKTEIVSLISSLKVKTNDANIPEIRRIAENNEFRLTRNLSQAGKPYSISHEFDNPQIEKRLISFLRGRLPFMLYFDDFTDRVPNEIIFDSRYKTDGKIAGKNQEWQLIIEEIFRRSDQESFDEEKDEKFLQNFINVEDKDVRDDILSDVTEVIEREIVQEWEAIKKAGLNKYADDSLQLNISMDYEPLEKGFKFSFKVKDRSMNSRQRTFKVSQRSKGFQWFFNYMIKLKFNPRYKGSIENSIFLLDEPGSYLHSSAQGELLKELNKVSTSNSIIYCTHSHYLLNPEIIKLGSVRIAEKNDGNIKLIRYGDFKGSSEAGALSPLYQSLQLNHTNEFVGKVIILEGIIDFYFFKLVQRHLKIIDKKHNLIAGRGAGNSSSLIVYALSFAEDFLMFFDNDRGLESMKKYRNEFTSEINSKVILYNEKKNFKLENFLCKKDSLKLCELMNAKNVKKAIAKLFFADEKTQKDFFKTLDSETLNSLRVFSKKVFFN